MKFYMTPGSCSTAIHILLEELGEAFEAYIVNLSAGDPLKPDYIAINPKSTVLALVREDGKVLTEVPAIAYWIAHAFPRARLRPQDNKIASQLVETMSYIVGTIQGQGFARIFATNSFTRNPADHEAVHELGREIVTKGFAILNAAIAPDGYLAGTYSAADPILFYVTFWADKTDIHTPENLVAHYRRMLTRPAVLHVLREDGYDLRVLGSHKPRQRDDHDGGRVIKPHAQ